MKVSKQRGKCSYENVWFHKAEKLWDSRLASDPGRTPQQQHKTTQQQHTSTAFVEEFTKTRNKIKSLFYIGRVLVGATL